MKLQLETHSNRRALRRGLGLLVFCHALLAAIFLMAAPRAQAIPVDTELSLVIDVSGSVSPAEYALQMNGYAAAFCDPTIQSNILSGPNGAIAINVVFFSHEVHTTFLETWQLLDSPAAIKSFANDMATLPRPGTGGTQIEDGMNHSTSLFPGNGFEGTQLIMDVSGDGPGGIPQVPNARDAAELAGITVNGLPIDGPFINDSYTDTVITPDGFIVPAASFADIEASILQKLTVETTPPDDPQGPNCEVTVRGEVLCPERPGDPYLVDLQVVNNSGQTAIYGWLTPCPDDQLPTEAVTLQPNPGFVFALPSPIPTGSGAIVPISIPSDGLTSDATVCFRLTLLDRSGSRCCTTKVCVRVPPCDCAELLDKQIDCEVQANGVIKYTITLTIRNRTNFGPLPFSMAHANFLPPTGFSPASVTISPAIAPGDTGTITTCYYGAPGEVCFNLALHDENIEKCCSLEDVCLTLPDCGHPCLPDKCIVTQKTPCCPQKGTATIVYTVCNNCNVPRTYEWSIGGTILPGCDTILDSAAFSPSGGTLGPVAPGTCASVIITVRCDGLEPAHCAGFRVCAIIPPLQAIQHCCRGMVYNPAPGELVLKQAVPGPIVINKDPTQVQFLVENPGRDPVDTVLHFAAEGSGLSFSATGQAGEVELSPRVQLQPGEQLPLTLDVFQLRPPSRELRFEAVTVYTEQAVAGGGTTVNDALTVPMQLALPPGAAPALRAPDELRTFSVSTDPVARVILRFQSEKNLIYRIQESIDLLTWNDVTCTVAGDITVDDEGRFVGTGEEVVCVVPCHTVTPKGFYRAVRAE